MDIPTPAVIFLIAVVGSFAAFVLALMFVLYDMATEAREYFKRENEKHATPTSGETVLSE